MWEFAHDNPGTALLMALILGLVVAGIFRQIFRTIRIVVAGWPPDHLDADGDSLTSCDCEDEEE